MSRRFFPASVALALALVAGGPAVFADEQLWSVLKGGGQVILMRHTATTPGVGDPPGMRLGDCSTQRNLTDEGRRHARQIGEALQAHGVSVEKVLASPMCRCQETARLAFGRIDESQPVSNRNSGTENEMPRQVREMRALASEKRRGGNLVLVSHGTTIQAVTGLATEPGEMVIVTPQGDGLFELRGKLMATAR